MAEKEVPKFKPEQELEKEKGKDVRIIVSVIRHGEKTPEGELSDLGLEKAKEEGRKKKIPEHGIKFYSSPFKRARDTAGAIVKGIEAQAKENKMFKSRTRLELAPPEWKPDVIEKVKEIRAREGQEGVVKYVLSGALAQKDLEQWTSGLAYLIDSYKRMADRLYSHSRVELMHVTHDVVITDFLRKVAVSEDKKLNLEDLGGSIKPLEGFDFEIYSDKQGQKHVKIDFRGKELNIDQEKFQELVNKFKQEPYKGRIEKQGL